MVHGFPAAASSSAYLVYSRPPVPVNGDRQGAHSKWTIRCWPWGSLTLPCDGESPAKFPGETGGPIATGISCRRGMPGYKVRGGTYLYRNMQKCMQDDDTRKWLRRNIHFLRRIPRFQPNDRAHVILQERIPGVSSHDMHIDTLGDPRLSTAHAQLGPRHPLLQHGPAYVTRAQASPADFSPLMTSPDSS